MLEACTCVWICVDLCPICVDLYAVELLGVVSSSCPEDSSESVKMISWEVVGVLLNCMMIVTLKSWSYLGWSSMAE